MSQVLEVLDAQIVDSSDVSSNPSTALVPFDGDDAFQYNAPANEKAARIDVRAMLAASGADFKVVKVPLTLGFTGINDDLGNDVFNGKRATFNNGNNAWGVMRADTGCLFGMRTDRHTLMQTVDFADIMQPAVDAGFGEYDGCLTLDKGGTIVLRYKMPKTLKIKGDASNVDCYLQIVVNHDSKRACSIYQSLIRAVCRNTLNAGIAQAKASGAIYTMKHLPNAMEKMDIAKGVLEKAAKSFDSFNARADRLASTRASLGDMMKLAAHLYPSKKDDVPLQTLSKREDLVRLFDSGTGIVGEIKGTRWAMLNAVTEHTSHNLKTNAPTEAGREAARAYQGLFGRGFDLQAETMRVLEVEGELVL